MAGLGKKTFVAGEVLLAQDVNGYLMDQSVMVFGGTAARSSAIPTPTEGMMSYRTDDDVVEVFDGSAYVGVGGAVGLTLINTTSFSAVASQSFNNVFSATYKKYKIIGNIVEAGANSCFFRLRASGTDAAGSNYVRTNYLLGAAAITPQGGTSTNFTLSDDNPRNVFFNVDLYDPFGTVNTLILYNTGFSGLGARNGTVLHDLTTSYDGFSVIAGISTISGEISVYGYNE
jgi:hypothetical protein